MRSRTRGPDVAPTRRDPASAMDRRRFLLATSRNAAVLAVPPSLVGCSGEIPPPEPLAFAGVGHVVDDAVLVFDHSGAAFELDETAHRVHRLGPSGARAEGFGRLGTGQGELNHPVDAAVGPDGSLYVVDRGNHRICCYDADGRLLSCFGEDSLHHPSDVTIHDGVLHVCDTLNHRVARFDLDGRALGALGALGDGDTLDGPRAVACGDDGRVWIVDGGDATVVVIRDGAVVERIGGYGDEPGRLRRPASIARSPDGRLFVGDVASGFVSMFDDEGRYVGRFALRRTDDRATFFL